MKLERTKGRKIVISKKIIRGKGENENLVIASTSVRQHCLREERAGYFTFSIKDFI